jgi:hypothetical protein
MMGCQGKQGQAEDKITEDKSFSPPAAKIMRRPLPYPPEPYDA